MSRYATNTDLDRYFKDFTTNYYGTYLDDDASMGTIFPTHQNNIDFDLERESAYINGKLSALGYKTPLVALGTSGTYDSLVTEWCSLNVIYKRLIAVHVNEYTRELPNTITVFREDAKAIEKNFMEGNIPLSVDISAEESGIGYSSIGAQTGVATFYNNRDYGGIYTDEDYEGRIIVQIDGVGGGSDIGKATFKWSRDGGVSWEYTECQTSTLWVDLFEGIKVKWYPSSGTSAQLAVNDWWYFDIVPTSRQVKQPEGYITMKYFERG